MKAFVKTIEGMPFDIQEVIEPKLSDTDVLIKVRCVGICGSDMPFFSGERKVMVPFIPGHEFSGDIVEVGKSVRRFRKGQRVTAGIVIKCNQCYYCSMGEETMCDRIEETGITKNGAFAEYVAVPESVLHEIPDKLSYEQGASVDPVASAYRAVMMLDIKNAEYISVIGPGPIGLYAIQIIKLMSKAKVIVIGTRDQRLEVARKLGADFILNINQGPIVSTINDVTFNKNVDCVIEATGNVSAVNQALLMTRKQGQIVLAGIFKSFGTIDPNLIVRKELTIKGSLCYTGKEFLESLELISSGKINTTDIITHKLPFSKIKEGIALIKSREAIKVCLFFCDY